MAYVYAHRKLSDHSLFYIGISDKDKYRKTTKHHRSVFWNNTFEKHGAYYEVLAENISFDEAKELEVFLIALIGRADINTGTLVNLTDGGDGVINVRRQGLKHNPRFTGKKHSPEVVLSIRERMMGTTPTKAIAKRCKKVYCESLGKTFDSISELSRELKISQAYASIMANGIRENKYGIKFT